MGVGIHLEVKTTLTVGPRPCLSQVLLFFPTTYARLPGPQVSKDSPVSTSHFTRAEWRLQMHNTLSSFYVGSRDPNSCLHTCMVSVLLYRAVSTVPIVDFNSCYQCAQSRGGFHG